jgi:hypothetical protein
MLKDIQDNANQNAFAYVFMHPLVYVHKFFDKLFQLALKIKKLLHTRVISLLIVFMEERTSC